MAIHIVTEANRCLNCKKPMCQQGCPVHTSIPVVIQLFKQNRLMEAGEMLFENNPLSAVCSIVCNHEKQCAGNCIRGRKDTPVHFSSIEAYISDTYLDRMIVNKPEMKKDKKAAVIGRSLVIGRPVGMMLMHENATVVNCHTRTVDVPSITRQADILIAAAGQLHSVKPDFTNPDQVVVDVGINWDEAKGGISGDVDFDAVEPLVRAISPVPGGVGSVTTCVLASHVIEAAARTL